MKEKSPDLNHRQGSPDSLPGCCLEIIHNVCHITKTVTEEHLSQIWIVHMGSLGIKETLSAVPFSRNLLRLRLIVFM